MPTLDTIAKVGRLPNEFIPQKPLIYVTHPDNNEDEPWVPPAEGNNILEPQRKGHGASCAWLEESPDHWDEPMLDTYAMEIMGVAHKPAVEAAEMWFYRTSWQNRGVYLKDDNSSRMLYYIDIPWCEWGTSLTIRRGSNSGNIVAESRRSGPGRPFEISFADSALQKHLDGDKLILKFGCIYSRVHRFWYRGRNLAWKHGFLTRRLKDMDTNELIAEFYMTTLSIHKDGKMTIAGEYAKDPLWIDVIITTALTCQQREREIKRAVTNGNGGF